MLSGVGEAFADILFLGVAPLFGVEMADRGRGLAGLLARTVTNVRAKSMPGKSEKVAQYFLVRQGIVSGSRVIISRLNCRSGLASRRTLTILGISR